MEISGGLPDSADLSVVSAPRDDPYFGENHALWVWDEEHRIGIHLYLKTLAHLGKYRLRRETVNVHMPDGTVLVSEQDGPGNIEPRVARGPNLQCECIEPFQRWSFRYDATAQLTSAPEMQTGLLRHMPLVPLEFELEIATATMPWVTATFTEGERSEWARQYFGGSRYEQLLWARGYVRTLGGEFPVVGGGTRTHRVGMRNTKTFPGHSWLTAIFPSGRAFGVQRFCTASGVSLWEEAFVEEEGKRHGIRNVSVPLFSGALPGERFETVLETPHGHASIRAVMRATTFVTSMQADPFRFCWGLDRSDPASRVMSQGLVSYEWDGEIGTGMVERSVRVFEMPAIPLPLEIARRSEH